MKQKLTYSFDDEVVSKFCYDMDNKKIEIHFDRYFDLISSKYVEAPSIWIIEKWIQARSKLNSENRYDNLENHIGVISMILFIELNNENLTITVNTIDGRYIDLLFENPQLRLV